MLASGRYFDAMNFATRIKCPVIVGVGLADTTCPPEGVFAAFNQIRAPKEIIIMPTADHSGDHRPYDRAAGVFFEKQKK
jgi:cephalosporin-C deacetylase-like acetyl esterase